MNQRFDYDVNYNFSAGPVNESWHMRVSNVVSSLPPIAPNINALAELPPTPEWTCRYENGTELEYRYLWGAYPVGNWSLIIDLWLEENVLNENQLINTQEIVGQNFTEIDDDSTSISAIVYSKFTGVLHTFQSFISNDRQFSNFTIMLILNGDVPTLFVAIGVAGAASITIAFFIVNRTMKKNDEQSGMS